MTIPVAQSAADGIFTMTSTTIGTTEYIPVLKSGRLKRFTVMVSAAVGTADETFTLSYQPPGGSAYTAVTNGAVVIATAGGAAGDQSSADFGVGPTTSVNQGGTFKVVSTGGGSAGVPLCYAFLIGP